MKIAVYYNLPSGGAKRALYEQVKRLRKIHQIDIYTLSTANHDFCDLRKLVRNYYMFDIDSSTPGESSGHPRGVLAQRADQPATIRGVLRQFAHLYKVYIQLPKIHKKIAQRINEGSYDVVLVCHDLFTQAPYVLKYLTIPSVYFCQEPKREFYECIPRVNKKLTYYLTLPFRYPLKFIDQTNIKHANLVLVNSTYSQKLIEKIYGVRAHVNYLGVDTNLFKRTPWVERENIALSVGGFNLLKGHDFIIRSIGLIPEERRPTFIIVGNGGEDKEYLKLLARQLRVRILFKENVTDERLVKWYNTARVFAYGPLREPFGLSPLEALSCGLPVVGVEDSGVAEVLRHLSDTLLIKRDIVRMSKSIAHIISEQRNYPKIEKDIDTITKKYNWEKSVAELEGYLENVCEK